MRPIASLFLLALLPVAAGADDGLAGLRSALAEAQGGAKVMQQLGASGPCAKGAGAPASPSRGKDRAIWAQSAVCMPFPLLAVWKAAMEADVKAFEGITRFNGPSALPAGARGIKIEYESRSRYMGMCHTARWPMEWTYRVVKGPAENPEEAVVEFARVEGGDFNGSFIKVWRGKIELRAAGAGLVSVSMRYEIDAPTQSPDSAARAVLAFFDRLSRRSSGQALPGPVDNPDCPY